MSISKQIVTIDGPSGVGKSTVSRMVAASLGYTYLDTGAMYRGVGFYFHRLGIAAHEEAHIAPKLGEINLRLVPAVSAQADVGVILNEENISDYIRTPEMSMIASAISALPSVRSFLTEMQRNIAASGKIVAEGRDMGTVVFPEADYKFFLDAEAEERCRRRVFQMRQKGMPVDEEQILQMILERDRNDRERAVAPLKKAIDARYIDTTALSVEEVCDKILSTVIDARKTG